jgi:hypothetical protein
MNPKRTFEAINSVLDAELSSEGAINEIFATLAGDGLKFADEGAEFELEVNRATIFTDPTFTGTVTISGEGKKLTGLPLPTDASDATSKSYVDALAQGIKARSQALVLVGASLDGTYDSDPDLDEFEAAENGAFPAVDGVASEVLNVVGARILLAAQSNPAHNGLYVLKTPGDSETK